MRGITLFVTSLRGGTEWANPSTAASQAAGALAPPGIWTKPRVIAFWWPGKKDDESARGWVSRQSGMRRKAQKSLYTLLQVAFLEIYCSVLPRCKTVCMYVCMYVCTVCTVSQYSFIIPANEENQSNAIFLSLLSVRRIHTFTNLSYVCEWFVACILTVNLSTYRWFR